MATDYQAMMDKFQNDPSYIPEIEDDNQPRIKPQQSGVKQPTKPVKVTSNSYQAVSKEYQVLSSEPRSLAPIKRETIRRATPFAMLVLGVLITGYSWRGGISGVVDLHRFVYGAIDSNTPKVIGLIFQMICTFGQAICSTQRWWKGFIIFLAPDAISTAWSLCKDFLLDLGAAFVRHFDAPKTPVYVVMVLISLLMGVYLARKGEKLIVDNYQRLGA